MLQLVYISTSRDVTADQLENILSKSRSNNARDDVTGLLLFNGKRFLQALEGPDPMVEAAYARIKADGRHRAAVILSRKSVEARQFGSWAMACEQTTAQSQGNLVEVVDALVSNVTDANIRALFSSYVRLDVAA